MDQILDQLGGLLLGSLPTIFLFLLLVIVYRLLVYVPLTRVLEQRREQTDGAVEQAHAATAAAEAKAQEYEAKVRAARLAIFHARETRLAAWNRERETTLAETRQAAKSKIDEAKKLIELESELARQTVEGSADDLARTVLRAVLPQELAVSGSPR